MLDLTNRDGDARRYLTFGWLETRSIGTWTEGPLAMLRLGLDPAPDTSRALDLEVDADPFIAVPQHPTLEVDVVVNGRQVAEWSYSAPFVAPVRRARIPVGVFAHRPADPPRDRQPAEQNLPLWVVVTQVYTVVAPSSPSRHLGGLVFRAHMRHVTTRSVFTDWSTQSGG